MSIYDDIRIAAQVMHDHAATSAGRARAQRILDALPKMEEREQALKALAHKWETDAAHYEYAQSATMEECADELAGVLEED